VSAVLTHPWNTDFAWQRPSSAPRRLGAAEVEQFHRDGWVVLEGLIDAATVTRLVAELDEIEQDIDRLLQSLPDKRMFIAEAGAITFGPHAVKQSAAAREVSRHPAIADICHDLLGPDIRLYWDQLVYKMPDKPREFPWHQDNGYTYVEPQQYLTVWLSLTGATVENGCPWVVPGIHTVGTLAHEYVDPLGHRCFVTSDDAIPAPVGAGGAVVFSSLTPHMTGPNTSDAVRKAYILQYAPDGAEVLEGDAGAGPPTNRVLQNDPDRQYPVLRRGEPVGTPA
jgi:ectoine hydroxylase-related dioxygenase (phytanoyl-CoA dioxygenase family)